MTSEYELEGRIPLGKAIILGMIICAILPFFLETTYMVDGETFIHSWVLQWDKVAAAAWFSLPRIMPVKFVFDLRAIFLVLCGFCPKLAAIVQLMPQSVLGGAAVFYIFHPPQKKKSRENT